MHKKESEYAGKTVKLKPDRKHHQGHLTGEFEVEDW